MASATPRTLLRRPWAPVLFTLLACAGSAGAPPRAAAAEDPPDAPAGGFDHAHGPWTALLRERVRGDRFDYAGLQRDPAPLQAYLHTLEAVTAAELQGWSREQRFAFWINAYNAFTVKRVVDDYPLKSIRDLSRALGLKSVFDEEFIPLDALHPEGRAERLSLNDIEHGILRKEFADARLHAAINCASISCPPLRNEAFVAERLDEQLDAQMRSFLADAARNRLDRAERTLELSKVFEWFREDFERDAGSVAEFVARFFPADERELVRSARLRYLDYDWGLNDVPREE